MASPGCVLRISGMNFRPDDFFRRFDLPAVAAWNKGDTGIFNRVHANSGCNLIISEREALDEQIEDAIGFVNAHRAALRFACDSASIDDLRLDFGIPLRDSVVQSNTFLPALVRLAAEFNIALELSQYPPNDGPAS
jgi:hypothetical protein